MLGDGHHWDDRHRLGPHALELVLDYLDLALHFVERAVTLVEDDEEGDVVGDDLLEPRPHGLSIEAGVDNPPHSMEALRMVLRAGWVMLVCRVCPLCNEGLEICNVLVAPLQVPGIVDADGAVLRWLVDRPCFGATAHVTDMRHLSVEGRIDDARLPCTPGPHDHEPGALLHDVVGCLDHQLLKALPLILPLLLQIFSQDSCICSSFSL